MEYEITMLANSESFQMPPITTVTFQTFYYFMSWFTTNIWILLNNNFKLMLVAFILLTAVNNIIYTCLC